MTERKQSIKEMFGTDENLPKYVVTAHNVDPFFRVKMQGVVQKYIDSSISSTVNLAEETTVNTVADIYMTAYKADLKGITVYREGSREGILITDDKSSEGEEKSSESEQMKTNKKNYILKVSYPLINIDLFNLKRIIFIDILRCSLNDYLTLQLIYNYNLFNNIYNELE